MKTRINDRPAAVVRSLVLVAIVLAVGAGLFLWKLAAARSAEAAAATQPEQVEVITDAVATEREHRGTTTSIGTVLATRSVTLRNEIPGTVSSVELAPGRAVDAGTVLVALDVSVEQAELAALQAQAELATTTLARVQRMFDRRAASAIELDNARAEREVALAQIERTRAIIARKTIRAPFRARVGISDVHPGQFLDAGTYLTTLQGIDDAAHVDFAVAQAVAAGLSPGDPVAVHAGEGGSPPLEARIVAVDARVDPATRSATVRARIDGRGASLSPGASVRVVVPVGNSRTAVAVPVSSLRKGPGGDHVFVLDTDESGQTRAHLRQVQAGPVLGDFVMILEGLGAGERVAASGSFKLREAALVHVADEAVATATTR
jgi:membrane fusion protein (multidrug efflux system)